MKKSSQRKPLPPETTGTSFPVCVKKPECPVLRTGMNDQYTVWVTRAIHIREYRPPSYEAFSLEEAPTFGRGSSRRLGLMGLTVKYASAEKIPYLIESIRKKALYVNSARYPHVSSGLRIDPYQKKAFNEAPRIPTGARRGIWEKVNENE